MRLFDDSELEAPTYTVAELAGKVGGLVEHWFPAEVWVRGVVANRSDHSPAGGGRTVYFDLAEAGTTNRTPRPSLKVVLFDQARQSVNAALTKGGNAVRIADGTEVRIRGRVAFYGPRSQVQLIMSAIDPAFTLGRLAAERELLLQRLATEGLLERNRLLALPSVPLRVALLTSANSAAEADFLHELEVSGFRFAVTVIDCRVQGENAPASIASGLLRAAAGDFDVVALVRGGGARTELAVFDHEAVARAVATCPLPVFTGIGHEIDRAVADEVAHTAHKTPTAAAAALVEVVAAFVEALDARWAAIRSCADRRLEDAGSRLQREAAGVAQATIAAVSRQDERLRSTVDLVAARTAAALSEARTDVRHAAQRSSRSARRALTDEKLRLSTQSTRVGRGQRGLTQLSERLDLLESAISARDPARLLARGWSMTYREDGRLVRSIEDVSSGDELATRLVDGTVRSTVV